MSIKGNFMTNKRNKIKKYYCNCEDFEIKSEDKGIRITQVRESKKLK